MEKESRIFFTKKESDVSEEDVTTNFEYFLDKRFPESLRKTGKRKWISIFFVYLSGNSHASFIPHYCLYYPPQN